jgi:hypothetical protein
MVATFRFDACKITNSAGLPVFDEELASTAFLGFLRVSVKRTGQGHASDLATFSIFAVIRDSTGASLIVKT